MVCNNCSRVMDNIQSVIKDIEIYWCGNCGTLVYAWKGKENDCNWKYPKYIDGIANIVLFDKDNQTVLEVKSIICNKEKAEKTFINICSETFSNFEEYTKEDIDAILDNGYEESTHRIVFLTWTYI